MTTTESQVTVIVTFFDKHEMHMLGSNNLGFMYLES